MASDLSRRRVLRNGLAAGALLGGGALGGLALRNRGCENRVDMQTGRAQLRADPKGILDLPAGFHYRVLQRHGDRMSDGFRVPAAPDGMGCIPMKVDGANAWVLMRNHELKERPSLDDEAGALHTGQATPSETYRPEHRNLGGVSRLVIDPQTLAVRTSNLVLWGTRLNCAGGVAPGGWLSCEEAVENGHGHVFFCDARAASIQSPQPLLAYGRFRHEAAAFDSATGICYLSEDRPDGCFYRFVPDAPRRSLYVGRLQALAIEGASKMHMATAERGDTFAVRWVDLDAPNPTSDTLREEAADKGAACFRRGEGLCLVAEAKSAPAQVALCTTLGGQADQGQVFVLAASGESIAVLASSSAEQRMNMPDNIVLAPWGDLLLAEDSSKTCHLQGLRLDGTLYDIARNAATGKEFAGVCCAPDGQTVFVNMQKEGLTVAIRGPFAQLSKNRRRTTQRSA